MAQIFSKYFGSFDLREREIVHFPGGLPGFEDQTQYAALSIPGQEPILYLQSLTRPELCLITLPARVFDSSYRVELNSEERETLSLPAEGSLRIGSEIACQVIVTVDENREPLANLAAPLIINLACHRGIQVFQAAAQYSFRHPLAATLQLAGC
jgi:flagellar assembly factor FliW